MFLALLHRMLTAFGLVAALVAQSGSASAGITYLALGDSLAFGVGANDTPTDISDGDRGYAGRIADGLASQTGQSVSLINLGVSGETSSSFFTGIGNIQGPDSRLRNTHYPDNTITQNSLTLATIAQLHALGRPVDLVTIQLGANDLFAEAASPTPDFPATLGRIATNVGTLLTELGILAPEADVALFGYYNPYPAVPGHPFTPFADALIQTGNQVLRGLAGAFGARFVDIYPSFVGNEATFTYITDPTAGLFNVHPTPAGYDAITAAVTAPEPSGLALMLPAGLGVVIVGCRRRRRRVSA